MHETINKGERKGGMERGRRMRAGMIYNMKHTKSLESSTSSLSLA